MRHITALVLALTLGSPLSAPAQVGSTDRPAETFKLGTFEDEGREFVGVVLRDRLVADLHAANAHLQLDGAYAEMPMPGDMIELIGRYEYGLKHRLYEIVTHLSENGLLDGMSRPSYVHDADDLRTLAPLRYPGKILNAAGNFYSHVGESGTPEEQVRIAAERRRNRGVPYLFLKPTRGTVIGADDRVVIPWGRNRTDWEVELSTVIGRTGKYVSARDAEDYVFGYMIMLDISDRGGRPPGNRSTGSDWFVGKGHDTFAPMGPWIVPKEFYGNPMEKLRQTLSVGDQRMQEATAGDMIHSVWEIIEYASSINTLYPGDVVNSGTSGGVGMSRVARASGQRFLQPGEIIEASIEGIGTLEIEVAGEDAAPKNLTGAHLPPVDSYREN